MDWLLAFALLWLLFATARATRQFVLRALILQIDIALATLRFGRRLLSLIQLIPCDAIDPKTVHPFRKIHDRFRRKMLKRAWLVISTLWALAAIWGGMGRPDGGLEAKDLEIAAFPFAAGAFLWFVGRYVLAGSFRKPRVGIYRPPQR